MSEKKNIAKPVPLSKTGCKVLSKVALDNLQVMSLLLAIRNAK